MAETVSQRVISVTSFGLTVTKLVLIERDVGDIGTALKVAIAGNEGFLVSQMTTQFSGKPIRILNVPKRDCESPAYP